MKTKYFYLGMVFLLVSQVSTANANVPVLDRLMSSPSASCSTKKLYGEYPSRTCAFLGREKTGERCSFKVTRTLTPDGSLLSYDVSVKIRDSFDGVTILDRDDRGTATSMFKRQAESVPYFIGNYRQVSVQARGAQALMSFYRAPRQARGSGPGPCDRLLGSCTAAEAARARRERDAYKEKLKAIGALELNCLVNLSN